MNKQNSLIRTKEKLASDMKAIGEDLIERSKKFNALHLDDHKPFNEAGQYMEVRTGELSGLMDEMFTFTNEVEKYNEKPVIDADYINAVAELARDVEG